MGKNKEGYADPTASIAMGNAMREFKNKQKEKWKKEYESKNLKRVYVISKFAGQKKKNAKAAVSYCRFVISQGKMPIASHLLYPQILDDENPEERALGMNFGLSLLRDCQEAWCFGSEISQGMAAELKECERLKIPVRYFKEEGYADISTGHCK